MAASNDFRIFEVTRQLRHPLSTVWKAWSQRDRIEKWWGPKGCAVRALRFEFRPGGFFHYSMEAAVAPTMWGRFNFLEISAPDRIVWLNSFSNGDCGMARAPFSDKCPLEILNIVNFSETSEGTTQTLRAEPFGATEGEKQFFEDLCSSGSLAQGFGGTFDQLSNHLNGGA
jgi:uncharacterized protein YndB with AHSA1/START domain